MEIDDVGFLNFSDIGTLLFNCFSIDVDWCLFLKTFYKSNEINNENPTTVIKFDVEGL